ncbi:MAG: RNase adapter RapZ [Elusimicrobia bacterium]|nr:RNase adapter RapZ [Elusimicrobiota bacterium]
MKARDRRKLFIITGLSGAGRSQALKIFEDLGFVCVDNLPVELLGRFGDMLLDTPHYAQTALGLDVRGGDFRRDLEAFALVMRSKGIRTRVLFLDASDEALVQRFSETRHRHPLGKNVLSAIRSERRYLADLKGLADKVIDTTNLALGELKEQVSIAIGAKRTREMQVSVVSFGYKYGLPRDADLVMDVRFMPNPYYVPSLRRKSGLDAAVGRYVLRNPVAKPFLSGFAKMVETLVPYYIREGKSYLTIAVGCTGGRHRSVFVTRHLAGVLRRHGYSVREFHRDIGR